ncbi:MAG TPA: ShlB/FhaC/HecB family hemolysin secretion/activation protein [Gemmatimonadaceae bacterium]|nr:ShlB/FhaC/HecB family hemolysin secretion/activation protein [Gemmatimonadaceae bacterium]
MLMILGAALALHAFQGGQAAPPERRSMVRDSAASDSSKVGPGRRRPKRLPVTAEALRTAFADNASRELFDRARHARTVQDSSLRSYTATTRQRATVTMGIGSSGVERTVYRSETVADVAWKNGVGARVSLTGARVGIPIAAPEDERDALKEALTNSDLTPVPYYPGNESLWIIGGGRTRTDVDDENVVNPLANGAEAYYTYAAGQSVSWQLPDGQHIQLRELAVRPRRPEWNLAVGSLWFDTGTGQLVRAAFRLAVPIDLWVPISERATKQDVKSKVGMYLAKALISPLEVRITGVTIEYGLFEGRYWLPRIRYFEGDQRITFAKFGFVMEQRFAYPSVNAPVAIAALPLNEPDPYPPRAPDSLSAEDARKWRDSARVVWRQRRKAFEDSLETSPCDTSGTRTLGRVRRGSDVPVAVTFPCDIDKLIASPAFDTPLYAANEQLFGKADRDALLASALPFGAQALIRFSELPKPDITYGLAMSRYNRIEGFSTAVGIEQQLGGGYVAGLTARIGTADREPNAELFAARTNLQRTVTVGGYNRLVSANDWGDPLSFGSSLSAFLFGRDEGFYYRASGADVRWTTDRGTHLDWRLFAEEQRSATPRNDYSWGAAFIPNIAASRGTSAGASVRWQHATGGDPRGLRTLTDTRFEAATGDSTYGRGAVDFTVTRGLTRNTAAALTLAGGSSIGQLTPQRRWFLGGAQTIRGQSPDTAQSGSAFWMSRGELALDKQYARVSLFGDVGWVGDRSMWREVGRPLSGTGVGLSMLDGLVRFDVARGIYPRRQTRVSAYVNARF